MSNLVALDIKIGHECWFLVDGGHKIGHGVVYTTTGTSDQFYPIEVIDDEGNTFTFTAAGYYRTSDTNPILSSKPYDIVNGGYSSIDFKYATDYIKRGDIVFVSNDKNVINNARRFHSIKAGGIIVTFADSGYDEIIEWAFMSTEPVLPKLPHIDYSGSGDDAL